jgi:hypothetical protein
VLEDQGYVVESQKKTCAGSPCLEYIAEAGRDGAGIHQIFNFRQILAGQTMLVLFCVHTDFENRLISPDSPEYRKYQREVCTPFFDSLIIKNISK